MVNSKNGKTRATAAIVTSHLNSLLPREKLDLAGSPEGLIKPGNSRAKDSPGKDQSHLSYTFRYYVSSKELTEVTCAQVAAPFATESLRCCYCAGILLLYSLFGPGNAPGVTVPLGTSLVPSRLTAAALVRPPGEAGKIRTMALRSSRCVRSSCQCSHDGSVTSARVLAVRKV